MRQSFVADTVEVGEAAEDGLYITLSDTTEDDAESIHQLLLVGSMPGSRGYKSGGFYIEYNGQGNGRRQDAIRMITFTTEQLRVDFTEAAEVKQGTIDNDSELPLTELVIEFGFKLSEEQFCAFRRALDVVVGPFCDYHDEVPEAFLPCRLKKYLRRDLTLFWFMAPRQLARSEATE
jgi:hypothetical protein